MRRAGTDRLSAPLAWLLAVGLVLAAPPAAADGAPLEYAVKATYLYKFGNFIEWPAAAFASPMSAVNLCVAGEDPFGRRLDDAVAGHSIGARPIVVRHLRGAMPDAACQILFVGGTDAGAVGRILGNVRGPGVLTVTEAPQAAGIIHFVVKDAHVRFAIDSEAAKSSGITVSSQLLALALPGTVR